MPKRLNYEPSDEELLQITKAIRSDRRPEVCQRATAIHLVHLGHKPAEVTESLAVDRVTVYNWHRRYRQESLEGLAKRPKGRPKRKADEAYCQALEAAKREPPEPGYPFAVWTVERLRDHLEKETGVHLSVSRSPVIIRKRGYVYRRPKHDLDNLQDPQAKKQDQELLEQLKKGVLEISRSGSSLWTKPS